MRKIIHYIPLHLGFFLVLGVLLGYYFVIPIALLLLLLSVGLVALWIFFQISKKRYGFGTSFQVAGYFLTLLIGVAGVTFQDTSRYKTHYSHTISHKNELVFQIDKVLKPGLYQEKYYAKLRQTDSKRCTGKILLNVAKDSFTKPLKVGELYLTQTSFSTIDPPLNPYSFDYGNYLKKQDVLHQISITFQELKFIKTKKNGLKVYAANWREKIQKSLAKYPFKKDEMSIMNAMILGQRQNISKELLENYAGAGVIHILAVSGLHVGILLILLNFLLKPLEKKRYGNYFKTVLVILILWGFALLTGLSGSVVRAVTMFSFIAVGLAVRRQKNSGLQALITSFFFLVLIHPLFIFDVGFQMSYAAVLGIFLFYPKIQSLIPHIRWLVPREMWQIFSVSVAATVGTLPISLYYFHQFPSLFFLSNIIIMPFLALIMGAGILMVLLALLNILPAFLAKGYGMTIHYMNSFIKWIAGQEEFLFQNISFSLLALVASYFFIAMGYRWWSRKKIKDIFAFFIAVILLQMVFFYEKYKTQSENEFVIFHKSRESVLGLKEGAKVRVWHSMDTTFVAKTGFINDYLIGTRTKMAELSDSLPNIFTFRNKKLLVVDSLGIYQNLSFKPNLVLLRQSPKVNLQRLLKELQPTTLIADGSNYKSYVQRWQKTCNKNKVNFHYTGKDGAYILK